MKNERNRLLSNITDSDDQGLGTILEFVVTTESSDQFLNKMKEVLLPIIDLDEEDFDTNRPIELLPTWFKAQFGHSGEPDHPTPQGSQSQEPDIDDWIWWLRPSERIWTWWNFQKLSADTLMVRVLASDWPTPLGSLMFLMRACGASDIVQR